MEYAFRFDSMRHSVASVPVQCMRLDRGRFRFSYAELLRSELHTSPMGLAGTPPSVVSTIRYAPLSKTDGIRAKDVVL